MSEIHSNTNRTRVVNRNINRKKDGAPMKNANSVRASFVASLTQEFPKSLGFAGETTSLVLRRPDGLMPLVMKNWVHVTRVKGDLYKVTAGFVGGSGLDQIGERKNPSELTWTIESHGVDLYDFVLNIKEQDHLKGIRLTARLA